MLFSLIALQSGAYIIDLLNLIPDYFYYLQLSTSYAKPEAGKSLRVGNFTAPKITSGKLSTRTTSHEQQNSEPKTKAPIQRERVNKD